MGESNNVVDHPHRSLRRMQAERLKEAFLARGKAQPDILARLSCTVERLNDEAKERYGPRSGAMQRAFGEELVRMKGRFTARGGVPPVQIYQTPEAWLRVINGLSTVLGRDPDSEVISALEDALSHARSAPQDRPPGWLDELLALVGPMIERLSAEVDLVEIADYIARYGLMLSDDEVSVSEWPFDHVGHSQDELYVSDFIALVPHVFGINYVPVTSQSHAMADFREELAIDIPELRWTDPTILTETTQFTFSEGIRTGAAVVVHAQSRQLEFALVETHHADVTITDARGKVIATIKTGVDLHELIGGGEVQEMDRAAWIGTPESYNVFRKPEGWVANSARFHFPGSAGFERLASSLIVRPSIWSDPAEYDFWAPGPEDAENCPVTSPRHTVAGAIEGNLLYADAQGKRQYRLDRLLLAEIRRVSTVVHRFRTAHETRRLANREALLAQWNAERQI